MKKAVTTLCFFFLISNSFAQDIDVLRLAKKSKYYTESNLFRTDSFVRFKNEVSYNMPGKVDEEYRHVFRVAIPLNSLVVGEVFDLARDSIQVESRYDLESVWNWGSDASIIKGIIRILSVQENRIKVQMNFQIHVLKDQTTYYYIGKRTFNKIN